MRINYWPVFRVLFFAALLLHHMPLIGEWERILLYGGNFRSPAYPPDLLGFELRRFPLLVWFAPYLMATGAVLGMFGVLLRLASILMLLGLYFFHASNDFGVNVAAVDAAFFILLVLAAFGSPGTEQGSSANRVERWFASGRLTPNMIAVYILTALFCAGLEKIHQGWLDRNALYVLLNTPAGTAARSWIVACGWCRSEWFGWAITYGTVLCELLLPILFLFRRTRLSAWLGLCLFFAAIQVVLAIPILFAVVFVGAPGLIVRNNIVNIQE